MGVITEHNALMRRKKERKREKKRVGGRGVGGKAKTNKKMREVKQFFEFSSNTPDELHFISAALLCLS